MASEINLETRLKLGTVSIKELSALSGRGTTSIYDDIKAGILPTVKFGPTLKHTCRVAGPVAVAYINGELHRDAGLVPAREVAA